MNHTIQIVYMTYEVPNQFRIIRMQLFVVRILFGFFPFSKELFDLSNGWEKQKRKKREIMTNREETIVTYGFVSTFGHFSVFPFPAGEQCELCEKYFLWTYLFSSRIYCY